MNAIRDTDLILYHYRDGLAPAELAAIEAALAASAGLRARYATLCKTLGSVDDLALPMPDDDFEARLWRSLESRMDTPAGEPGEAAAHVRSEPAHHSQRRHAARDARRAPRPLAWAGAFGVLLAVATAFYLGRHSAPGAPIDNAHTSNAMATRVLDAYVAAHLRETEGLVLTAVNSSDSSLLAGNRELAANLIDSNRIYASAAMRAGNSRLADFLRQLEPLLLELANPPAAGAIQSPDGLRDYVEKTDLLFQLRATEARIAPRRPTSA